MFKNLVMLFVVGITIGVSSTRAQITDEDRKYLKMSCEELKAMRTPYENTSKLGLKYALDVPGCEKKIEDVRNIEKYSGEDIQKLLGGQCGRYYRLYVRSREVNDRLDNECGAKADLALLRKQRDACWAKHPEMAPVKSASEKSDKM